MYKFKDSTPDWLYHPANLDDNLLPQIQKELKKFFLSNKNQSLVPMTSTYIEYYDIKTCPTLIQQLEQWDLYTKFWGLAFISVDSTKIFPPHVDADVDCALNIPVFNCEGTYTVWYDGKIEYTKRFDLKYAALTDDENIRDKTLPGIPTCWAVPGEDNAREIERLNNTHPYWMNVQRLHNQLNLTDNTAVSCTILFTSEILEMIASGDFDAKLVKK